MIQIRSTPNEAGVSVLGDLVDIEGLYESLHEVVGEEGELERYEGARLRVLGVCYELRHALMGDREIEFKENGLDTEKIKRFGVIAQDKNIYYKIEVLWPELLFVVMVLNDFIWFYAKKQTKSSFTPLTEWRNSWNPTISQVRMFQAAVARCLSETLSEASFPRVLKQMNRAYPWMDSYLFQYVDLLNIRFLEMDRDTRRKNISIMVKRLAEKNKEYTELEQEVAAAARQHHCTVFDIKIGLDYPADFEW
ncbi:DUF6904 family protein [Alicyclobacillus fodiniaquatilis]|uniref:DUF6904 family protein n=1 Tax=Alicyclobacillus fodiniaquatilis TaxID=1661150 RepID=A0ABW4JS05_9BACL